LDARVRLDGALLGRAAVDGGLWTSLEVVDSLESSNLTLAQRARSGAPHGSVLVAEEQTAGRGRRDRGWSAPQYSSVMVSVLVRPDVDPARWGWIPLLTAVAIVDAVRAIGVSAGVKWPNDVLVGDRKLAGILCEVVPTAQGGAVVAGWGVNVDQSEAELPSGTATSLRLECGGADRAALLLAVLDAWESWYRSWETEDDQLFSAYTQYSATIGRQVDVELPDGSALRGSAARIDDRGGLVVVAGGREHVIAAADVVHLRPQGVADLPRCLHGLSREAPDRG
jgi:BirA family biotin operon repressor/biotin-[acetyl-CoA-carboxylase] ligase